MFPDKVCDCPPGAHQPIAGTVQVRDPVEGDMKSVRRSTLAAEWTEPFCSWLLGGLEALRQEGIDYVLDLEQPIPSFQLWDTIPVEVEKSPEGQIR